MTERCTSLSRGNGCALWKAVWQKGLSPRIPRITAPRLVNSPSPTQAGQLRGSDAAPVVAVEAEDNVVPAQLPERDRPPLGAGQLELGRGLAPPERRNDAHSGDFRQGSQPPRGHEMGRRLATFLSIPYAAFSRTRHGDSSGGLPFHRPRNRQVDPIPAHPPGARAPGLRGMHDRAELPAAQGLRLAELGETEDQRVSTESTTYRDWWRAFNDPVLDRLVARAYRDNLTLRQAGVRVLQARAQLGIAVGEVFPQTQQAIGSVEYYRTSDLADTAAAV